MPYTAYTKMSRDDVLAIRAYLNTVDAGPQRGRRQHAAVPVQHPRSDAGVGRALFHAGRIHSPIRSKSAEWNRGAFLVEGPAHCGACHTPKTFLGGDKTGEYLQGSYLQGWFAPDITNDNADRPRRAGRPTTSWPI